SEHAWCARSSHCRPTPLARPRRPIGTQHQYLAAFGGLTVLELARDGAVEVTTADVSDSVVDELQRNLLVFYTGTERSSLDILSEQSRGVSTSQRAVVD